MADILARMHSDPLDWLYRMGVQSEAQIQRFTTSCEYLHAAGLTPEHIRKEIEKSPVVLDILTAGDAARALNMLKAVLPGTFRKP
jgi:hypothetical protein